MTVFDIIQQRRSIGKMTDERPTREQIERLLEAATHAPNHPPYAALEIYRARRRCPRGSGQSDGRIA